MNLSDITSTCHSGRRPGPAWLLVPGALGTLVWAGIVLFSSSVTPLEQGRIAFEQGDFDLARTLTDQAIAADPQSSAARMLAAEVAVTQGRYEDVVRFCESIPVDRTRDSIESEVLCGQVLLEHLRLISPAEQRFGRVLIRAPDHPVALDRLAYLLSLETRAWDLVPVQLSLIRAGSVTPQRVYSLGLGHRLYPDLELIREYHETDPAASGPLLALARIAARDDDWQRARELLVAIVIDERDHLEAQSRLGALVLDQQDTEDLARWLGSLPSFAMEHPGICEALGRVTMLQGDDRGAARYFWEALRLDPNLPLSNYQCGQCLVRLGEPDQAAPFLNRARLLEEYIQLIDRRSQSVDQAGLDTQTCRRASELCHELGLAWEELCWLTLVADIEPVSSPESDRIEELYSETRSLPLARTRPGASPADQLDLSDLPLLNWNDIQVSPGAGAVSRAGASFQFTEMAAEAGIQFEYYRDADPSVRGMGRAFEFTGGGVAAVDYDCDGWPDIYLSQGAVIPPSAADPVHLDRLCRNTGSGVFVDVTTQAAIYEERYSQGVAAGDVNDDGFPDVFVSNLGPNRLFLNNGDGTFSDGSGWLPETEGRWTTSAAMVDLNADGLPEIYAVNYLTAPDLLTRICRDEEGPLAPCTPRDFDGAVDQLFWNIGDGLWTDVAGSAGIALGNGKGLGILAADFDGNGRIEVFVANDGVANFFFQSAGESPRAPPRFEERALRMGLAYNEHGRAEACMGILAEDLNNDRLIDLFVTNFHDESNTFYRQQPDLLFEDATRSTGFHEVSYKQLGFGTQVIDVDLDGRSELFVSNGHVDDYTSTGIPYEMPPQLLHNVSGDLQNPLFELVAPEKPGSYFDGRYLGRAVARLDWNRDGREDIVVTHLDAPTALLTNHTEPLGRSLNIILRGTASGRDAMGTQVTLSTGGRTSSRQLMAGDGYQCTNERSLVFGMGQTTEGARIEVQWTSGLQQTFVNVAMDQSVIIVEGCAGVFPIQRVNSQPGPDVSAGTESPSS